MAAGPGKHAPFPLGWRALARPRPPRPAAFGRTDVGFEARPVDAPGAAQAAVTWPRANPTAERGPLAAAACNLQRHVAEITDSRRPDDIS